MKTATAVNIFITSCLVSSFAHAQVAELAVSSTGIKNDTSISYDFAYCAPDNKGKTRDGINKNPQLSWTGAPAGTKSFAIVMYDTDVPEKFDDANKEGKVIDENFPRQIFYHWVVTDIPVNISEFAEGYGKDIAMQSSPYAPAFSYKSGGIAMINDYASFMKDRPATAFLGYDGPCPPWNDARVHNYHFKVYALDVESLGLKGASSGKEAAAEIEKHALARGEIVAQFSNYKK